MFESLNGASLESMQAKYDEMFPVVVEEVKVEKKQQVTRKKAGKKVDEKKGTSKKVGKKAKVDVK